MIVPTIGYKALCDVCETQAELMGQFASYDDMSEVIDDIDNQDWIIEFNKFGNQTCVCDNCYIGIWDSEEEEMVYWDKSITKVLKYEGNCTHDIEGNKIRNI